MSKKSENLSDLNKKNRNKRHSSPFINVVKGVFFFLLLFVLSTIRLVHLFIVIAWKARRRLDILPVSKARTNKFYIYRQCTYIVYVFVIKHLRWESWNHFITIFVVKTNPGKILISIQIKNFFKSRTTLRVKSCCWSCFYINETLRPVIRALFLIFNIPYYNDFYTFSKSRIFKVKYV
jgi:hypothetical protein